MQLPWVAPSVGLTVCSSPLPVGYPGLGGLELGWTLEWLVHLSVVWGLRSLPRGASLRVVLYTATKQFARDVNSSVWTRPELAELRGLLVFRHWPVLNRTDGKDKFGRTITMMNQIEAMHDCLWTYGTSSTWVFPSLDSDEFPFSASHAPRAGSLRRALDSLPTHSRVVYLQSTLFSDVWPVNRSGWDLGELGTEPMRPTQITQHLTVKLDYVLGSLNSGGCHNPRPQWGKVLVRGEMPVRFWIHCVLKMPSAPGPVCTCWFAVLLHVHRFLMLLPCLQVRWHFSLSTLRLRGCDLIITLSVALIAK